MSGYSWNIVEIGVKYDIIEALTPTKQPHRNFSHLRHFGCKLFNNMYLCFCNVQHRSHFCPLSWRQIFLLFKLFFQFKDLSPCKSRSGFFLLYVGIITVVVSRSLSAVFWIRFFCELKHVSDFSVQEFMAVWIRKI